MTTHSKDQRKVTCCGIDQTPTDVICGQGKDCAAACKAKDDASLSPTGRCDDCENIEPGYSCTSSSESSCANSCVKQGCKDASCCYHEQCRKTRPEFCAWTDNYWGKQLEPHKYLVCVNHKYFIKTCFYCPAGQWVTMLVSFRLPCMLNSQLV